MTKERTTNNELPEGWATAPIGHLVELNPKTELSDDLEVGFVPMTSIGTGFLETVRFESKRWKDVKKGYTHFQDGDVLLAKITPCFENGKGALVGGLPNGAGAGSTEYFVCRTKKEVLRAEYLHAYFKTPGFMSEAETQMSGSVGHKRVPKEQVVATEIPLPPLAEQKRIADKLEAVLGRVDACRARLDRVPDLLKRFRQSVLAAATSGQLTEDWRETNATNARWRSVLFGDVVTSSFYGPRFSADDYSDSGVPTIRTTDMNYRGDINLSESPGVRITEAELERLGLKDGDLVITRTGATIGKCGLYRDALGPALPSAYLIRFRLNQEAIDPNFALRFLMSPDGQSHLIGGTTAVAQPNVNAKAISAIPLSLPPLPEQAEIVHRVEALFAMADRIEVRLSTARAQVERLTPATLAKAFRGDLVPQDPNDEPASKLLERLKPH